MQTHVSATNNPRPVVLGLLLIITMSKAQICSLLLIITMGRAQTCGLLLIITKEQSTNMHNKKNTA